MWSGNTTGPCSRPCINQHIYKLLWWITKYVIQFIDSKKLEGNAKHLFCQSQNTEFWQAGTIDRIHEVKF